MQMKKIIAGTSVMALSLSMTSVALAAVDTDQVELTVEVAENMTLACGADVDMGTVTATSPVTGSTTCTVTTNDQDGYVLAIEDDNGAADVVLNHEDGIAGADWEIADKTAWTPGTPNAAAWSGTGLGFGVYASTATKNATWWGSGATCGDASNLFAGVPDTSTSIMEHTAYSNTSTTTSICYTVDVPSTQSSGVYDGSVTYTATGRL